MRTCVSLLIVLSIIGVARVHAYPLPQLVWSCIIGTNAPDTTYEMRQIMADGAGGCALVYTVKIGAEPPFYYFCRLDKKGTLTRWSIASSVESAAVTFCDKKNMLVTYATGGIASTMNFGAKGTTKLNSINYFTNPDGASVYGSPSDKTSFFVIGFDRATGEYRVERYLHKPQK
ncbi:MAG: hypothetical protein NTV22_12265 [bacterium]|nr:hypothetical protein [bacterium]